MRIDAWIDPAAPVKLESNLNFRRSVCMSLQMLHYVQITIDKLLIREISYRRHV
jgi:hypothetical protein